jgi:hypothetical protein
VSISVPRNTMIQFEDDNLRTLKYIINGKARYTDCGINSHSLQPEFQYSHKYRNDTDFPDLSKALGLSK